MRDKDLREIRRRFEEVERLYAAGYDPVDAFGELLWEKCHCGSWHTHRGALLDVERDRRRGRNR